MLDLDDLISEAFVVLRVVDRDLHLLRQVK
jgi:hypothetical protein